MADKVAELGMAAYRAPSLFQPHRMRQALRDAHEGKIPPLIGYYLGLSSIPTLRYVAPMGFDVIWIDWEHSSCNVETMTTLVHEISFMSEGRTIPLVRVPSDDHATLAFALDAGASIVVPQVETVEQAKHIVSGAKYGARNAGGSRSAPPFRLVPGLTDACIDGTKTLHQNINDQAAIIIQIESMKGVENLDAILTEVPEIDAVWIGTLDLRVNMDLPGFPIPGKELEPEFVAAMQKYHAVVAKHDKPTSGLALGDDETKKQLAQGKSFIVSMADVLALSGHIEELAAHRALYQPLKK